jgi:hypothetical protein
MPAEGAKEVVDHTQDEALDPYGDLVPFADPSWYQGVSLPQPSTRRVALKNELTKLPAVPLTILQGKPRRTTRRSPRMGIRKD